MTLNKKQRIVLFVVLSFIYILFFSIYSVKADISPDLKNIELWNYNTGDLCGNLSSCNSTYYNFTNKVNTFTFVDQTFYNAISDTSRYYNGIANFAFDTQPYTQYFTFVVLSTIEPIDIHTYFSRNNSDIDLSQYCTIESNLVPIENDNNYYASVVACKLSERRYITNFGVKFTNTTNLIVPSSLSISDIQFLQDEAELDTYYNKLKDDFLVLREQVPDNIIQAILNNQINSTGWGASMSFWNSHNASNGVITNIVTLPITLIQSLIVNSSSSCTPFNLGNLLGTNLQMPCINLSDYLGNALISTIDTISAGFMIYHIARKFVKVFDDLTNLRDTQISELYGGGK